MDERVEDAPALCSGRVLTARPHCAEVVRRLRAELELMRDQGCGDAMRNS